MNTHIHSCYVSFHSIYFWHPLIYFWQPLYGSYICTLMRASPPLSPVCFQQMSLSKKPKCHLSVLEFFMLGHILRTGPWLSMKHQAIHPWCVSLHCLSALYIEEQGLDEIMCHQIRMRKFMLHQCGVTTCHVSLHSIYLGIP